MRSWSGLLVLLFGLPVAAWGQSDTLPEFKPLLRRLWHERFANAFSPSLPVFQLPVVYRDSTHGPEKRKQLRFEVQLAPRPLGLQRRVVKLAGRGYPVCYSVVFQGCLVALFKHGRFGCYRLPNLEPDVRLARQLNVANWQRFWLIGGRLVAQRTDGYYAYDAATHDWSHYEAVVPFGNQPKLYEDDRYLVYATCNGEFGGTAYFYNKQTARTHYVGATCANSVWQENGRYRLLASLGHMMGSAGASTIIDPDLLPLVSAARKKVATDSARTIGKKNILPSFDFYGLQLFAALPRQPQTLYLMNWRSTTFLATIDSKRITIVDPLFADDLYTFNPVTTSYGPDLALTNLNSNDLPEINEAALLLWQGQQLTKIEWSDLQK